MLQSEKGKMEKACENKGIEKNQRLKIGLVPVGGMALLQERRFCRHAPLSGQGPLTVAQGAPLDNEMRSVAALLLEVCVALASVRFVYVRTRGRC